MATREQNERKFLHWVELADGGRRYWLDVSGHQGWRARYIKIVNSRKPLLSTRKSITNTASWWRSTRNSLWIEGIVRCRRKE